MEALEKVKKYNQEHLLKYKDELSDDEFSELIKQIDNTDFSYLDELNQTNKTQELNYYCTHR